MALPSFYLSIIYLVGMLSVFGGERLAGGGNARAFFTCFGLLLTVLAAVLRVPRAAAGDAERRRVERWFAGLYLLGIVSLLLYFGQSDAMTRFLDKPIDQSWPRVSIALAALWPAVWIAAMAPIALGEMAYAAVARAPSLERLRIHDAVLSGFGLAGAMVFAFSATYVATQRDKKIDLSYFRTAKPGEATHKIIRALDKPLQVSIFFPPANEVREEVQAYFDDIKSESSMLEVSDYDFAVDPVKAKELGVSGNGIIVVSRAARREQLSLGLELEGARFQLRNLDKEIQKRLLQVARPQRTVYLTTGHGERTSDSGGDTDKRATIRDLRELLTSQGYQGRNLGAAEGLASEIPQDAAVVMVLGPQKPLLAEEAAALDRYVARNGRLFVALDPESGSDWKELVAPFGVTFTPTVLANDQVFARKSYQQSDRGNIATGAYSSHASVTTLSRLGMRAPMILVQAGHLEEIKGHAKDLSVDFSVHAHPSTWVDTNSNWNFDPPGEVRKTWELAAAITKKKAGGKTATEDGRVVVLADSDALADGVIGNPGNAYFVLDAVKWLLGDEAISGEVSSETDQPLQHTRKQDNVWFYSSIILGPALVIGLGGFVTRRRRKSSKPTPGTGKESA